MGCFLTENHILTAAHIPARIIKRGNGVSVFRWDASLSAEVVWASEDYDVAVLRTRDVEQRQPPPLARPSWFPQDIGERQLGHGLTVGYFTRLRRKPPSGDSFMYSVFFSSTISFVHSEEKWKGAWGLSDGHIESGFSGSPVFATDGHLLSVVVGELLVSPAGDSVSGDIPQFPLIACLDRVAVDVQKAIQSST
jgi:hypothetical protein